MTKKELAAIEAEAQEGKPWGSVPDYEIARLRRHVRLLAREIKKAWLLLESERQALEVEQEMSANLLQGRPAIDLEAMRSRIDKANGG